MDMRDSVGLSDRAQLRYARFRNRGGLVDFPDNHALSIWPAWYCAVELNCFARLLSLRRATMPAVRGISQRPISSSFEIPWSTKFSYDRSMIQLEPLPVRGN